MLEIKLEGNRNFFKHLEIREHIINYYMSQRVSNSQGKLNGTLNKMKMKIQYIKICEVDLKEHLEGS